MISIVIHEKACRGCRLCVDLCPTKVLAYDEEHERASVGLVEDCIGCLSCAYACPSNAITHGGIPIVKNFYRDVDACARLGRYL